MLKYKYTQQSSTGFTLIELLIVISLIGIIVPTIYGFVSGSFSQYFNLQRNSSNFAELSSQSQRIAATLRGATNITEATSTRLTITAYWSDKDLIVSEVTFYTSSGDRKLLADITPFTANPPAGTPDTTKKRTITFIDDFYRKLNTDVFVYLTAAGSPLTLPITSLNTIKGIQLNIASPNSNRSDAANSLSQRLTLRNRKTNL